MIKVKCDNCLCIYEENGFCFNTKVSISDKGTCKNCTYPKFEEKLLAELNTKMLKGITLKASDNFDGGFRIAVKDGGAYYDYFA